MISIPNYTPVLPLTLLHLDSLIGAAMPRVFEYAQLISLELECEPIESIPAQFVRRDVFYDANLDKELKELTKHRREGEYGGCFQSNSEQNFSHMFYGKPGFPISTAHNLSCFWNPPLYLLNAFLCLNSFSIKTWD